MDGLAASLATVSCAVFAVAALDQDSGELALVVALALGGACLGFLPFNLRPGRSARVFMGDSGSQVIGFGLASLALASSWTTAGATADERRAAAARAGGPDPGHDVRDRAPHDRAAACDARRHRPLVAPARLLRPLRAAGRCRADAAGGAARRHRARIQRAREPPRHRSRAADLVRRPRPVRQLPRRPAGALAQRGSRPGAAALARVLLQPPPPRRGADGLRDHLLLVPGVVSPVRRRRWHEHAARALPGDAADPARRHLRPLRPLRDLPADLAVRVGTRPARDRRRGRAVRAAHDRDRQGDSLLPRLPARDLHRRRAALRDARGGIAPGAAAAAGLGSVRTTQTARPHRRRRPLGPRARARAGRDAGRPASSGSSTTTRR